MKCKGQKVDENKGKNEPKKKPKITGDYILC